MHIILKTKLKNHTKDVAIVLGIIMFWFVVIIAIMTIKYKPAYEVKIQGENLGYIKSKVSLKIK